MSLQCKDIAIDGVYLGEKGVKPTCLNIDRCKTEGCLWRQWHQFPPDKYASFEPPKYAPFLELV